MKNLRYLANPDVIHRELPFDEAILVNPDTGGSFVTNPVGYLIWQMLASPLTRAEIITRIIRECEDAPPEQVPADVDVFLQALQRGGYIGEVMDENG